MNRKEGNQFKKALVQAVRDNDIKQAELLVRCGININAKDRDGWTPLHHAAFNGNAECIRLLIKAGADIDVRDGADRTPLYCTAFRGHIDCIKLLIEAGADTEAQDCCMSTPFSIFKRFNKGLYEKHIDELMAARPEAKHLKTEDAAWKMSTNTGPGGPSDTGFEYDI